MAAFLEDDDPAVAAAEADPVAVAAGPVTAGPVAAAPLVLEPDPAPMVFVAWAAHFTELNEAVANSVWPAATFVTMHVPVDATYVHSS